MILTTFLCDKCVELGVRTPADCLLLADEAELAGPDAGDVDTQPLAFLKWHMLCRQHHTKLPVEARMAYVSSSQILHEIY